MKRENNKARRLSEPLMKKGLRRFLPDTFLIPDEFERTPDEKGIKTRCGGRGRTPQRLSEPLMKKGLRLPNRPYFSGQQAFSSWSKVGQSMFRAIS